MKKIVLLIIMIFACFSPAAMTWSLSGKPDANWWKGSTDNGKDVATLWGREVETILETAQLDDGRLKLTKGTALPTASEGLFYADDTNNVVLYYNGSSWVNLCQAASGNTLDQAYDQGGAGSGKTITASDGAVTITSTDADSAFLLAITPTPGSSAALGGLSITSGSNATQDCVQINNSGSGDDIQGTSSAWKVTKAGSATFTGVTTATLDVTGSTTFGDGTSTIAVNTSSWDVSSAGAISGVSDISLSGDITFATTNGLKSSTTTAETMVLQGYDVDNTTYRDVATITNGNTIALAFGTGNETVAVNSTTWDISTAGVFSGVTGFTGTGTFSINDSAAANTTSIGGGTTTGAVSIGTGAGNQTVDVGTGAAVKTVTVGSTNTTSATVIQSGTGDVAITSTDDLNIGTNATAQDITIGNITGATSLALKCGTGNFSLEGVAASTVTIGKSDQTGTMKFGESTGALEVDLATGNSNKTVNLGTGTGVSAINIATGGTGAKTIAIGDGASTGTTSIYGGSGGAGLNVSTNQPTNINTGTSTGQVTIGSTTTTQAILIQSGTGDVTATSTDDIAVTATDDLTINGGSAGSIIAIGTNTHGNVLNIATDDTAADTLTIGSAKDNTKISGSVLIRNLNFAADAEVSDTYVITLSPAASAYSAGMMIVFTATTANTGACTVNVNGLGAKALKSLHDNDPPDNYIEAGSVVMAVYDGTNFQMIQPDANP